MNMKLQRFGSYREWVLAAAKGGYNVGYNARTRNYIATVMFTDRVMGRFTKRGGVLKTFN